MIGASLTEKQQQLVRDLVRLCQVSQHRSFRYTPAFNDHNSIEAKGTSIRISGGDRGLRTLAQDGFLSLRWVRHGAAEGSVTQQAFDAVRENFGRPPEEAPSALASADDTFTAMPDGVEIAARLAAARPAAATHQPGAEAPTTLSGLLADLCGSFRSALPADEAHAAEADAAAISRQLGAARPDADVVARRLRSLIWHAASAAGSAADLSARGGKLAEALQRLSSLVVLLSHLAPAQRGRG